MDVVNITDTHEIVNLGPCPYEGPCEGHVKGEWGRLPWVKECRRDREKWQGK